MTTVWPEPVERVASFLRATGAEARIEEFATETPTAEAAADAVGCTLGQIVKSLVFVCDGTPVAALVPGDRRADSAKIARLAGARRAAIAKPAEVVDATGFSPGGVAPFPLERVPLVLVERTLVGRDDHVEAVLRAQLRQLAADAERGAGDDGERAGCQVHACKKANAMPFATGMAWRSQATGCSIGSGAAGVSPVQAGAYMPLRPWPEPPCWPCWPC